ncbi:MAG: alginate lyase family protein [Armatimonadota bacterium]
MLKKNLDKERVIPRADKYLSARPVTITASRSPRSAGGSHDFFSEGDYWWPDPNNPSGPYIQRDGMTNPQNFVQHRQAMIRFSRIVAALTSAFTITGEKRYGVKAAEHLVAWFVAPDSRMTPHLLYAQAIQGRFTGRGIGIIDTIHLVEVARSVHLLDRAGIFAPKVADAIKEWFRVYLLWLTTHPYGQDEKNNGNNHSTCWVMQVAAFASLTGDTKKEEECRSLFKNMLLPGQMAADGSFPRELKRTKPYGYSLFNLDAMAAVCHLLSRDSDNLWKYTTPDGRSMRRGIEFLYPFIKDKGAWPYPKDVMFWEYWPVRSPALLFGGLAYREKRWLDLWQTLEPDPTNEEVLRNLPLREPTLWLTDANLS